ncbi:CDGSH iron-sulfur domain-containing protein [Streptomyces zhihengii]
MTVDGNGPILIEGPVEIVQEDGTIATSDRFVVAVCTCRRSRMYPWCDTSHRRRTKSSESGHRDQHSANAPKEAHDSDN